MNRRVFPGQAPAPRMVDLTEADGTTLRATYFAHEPGPGMLLFHQCDP